MKKEQLILLLKQYKENNAKLKLRLREKEALLRKLEHLKDTYIFFKEVPIIINVNNKIQVISIFLFL